MKKLLASLSAVTLLSATIFTGVITTNAHAASSQAYTLSQEANGLNPKVIQLALNGFNYAKKQGKVSKNILTVVDYTKASKQERMYVFDLTSNTLLMKLRVAHGKNTGLDTSKHFSNKSGSSQSSLGVFTTSNTYTGKHGYSLRINGIEKGINSNAASRAIVVHSAWYMTDDFVNKYNRTGRSDGCLAVNPSYSKEFINYIKGGSVIFSYAPQENNDPNIT